MTVLNTTRWSWWWRDVVSNGNRGWFWCRTKRQIGDGADTKFWDDVWVGNDALKNLFPRLHNLSLSKDYWIKDMGHWNEEVWEWKWLWRRQLFGRETDQFNSLCSLITNFVPTLGVKDGWKWEGSNDGRYGTCVAYNTISSIEFTGRSDRSNVNSFNLLWKNFAPPKAVTSAWRTLHDRLPIGVNLRKRRVIDSNEASMCAICGAKEESSKHFFLECTSTVTIWLAIYNWFDLSVVMHMSLFDHFLQNLGFLQSHFQSSLEHVDIMGMHSFTPLSNMIGNRLALLKNLTLACLDDLECVPDWLLHNNPNLSYLEIWNFRKLRELPESLWCLSSLKDLRISYCPSLERIADPNRSQGSCFTKLFHLNIHKCDTLVYLPCELVGPLLETFLLMDLSSLENLPSLIDCLPKSTRLQKLKVEGVPTFMATGSSCAEIWALGSLQELSIDVSERGLCSGSVETVDAIFRGCCHSLTWLCLTGIESLPQSIQHLTALSFLILENFGVEELPEWLGNLSSIRWLYLYNCKELRRLHSMAALWRLTSLHIKGCPKLRLKPCCDTRSSSSSSSSSLVKSIFHRSCSL